MRMRAGPKSPLVGPRPGRLQGVPKGRKVIREPAPPTADAGDGDGQGAVDSARSGTTLEGKAPQLSARNYRKTL